MGLTLTHNVWYFRLESFYYRVLVIVAGSLGNNEIDIDALSIWFAFVLVVFFVQLMESYVWEHVLLHILWSNYCHFNVLLSYLQHYFLWLGDHDSIRILGCDRVRLWSNYFFHNCYIDKKAKRRRVNCVLDEFKQVVNLTGLIC